MTPCRRATTSSVSSWGRVSSAYGYAQAKDETWADYKREAGGWGASRDDFADALDFMGWYIQKSQRVNGVSSGTPTAST